MADKTDGGIHVEQTLTVYRPPAEVYGFWHDFQNLPRFMQHLQSVQVTGPGRSHWVATAPLDRTVAWDAEVTADEPNRRIAWRSLPGADVDNDGEVRFALAPGGRGTEVRVTFDYKPPAGPAGAAVAKLFGEEPLQQVQDDLRRFKAVLEAGEYATTEGQPTGREAK